MNSRVSVVVLSHNEENAITDCLESLAWCDEQIVIDDNSDDRTVELATRQRATVYTNSLQGDFSKQRNFGLQKAKNEWVLFVDADERVSDKLEEEIIQFVNSKAFYNGVYIKRIDSLWGKKLRFGEVGNVKLLRLGKKEKGMWRGKVHEKWNIEGATTFFTTPLEHYPHQTISEFLSEINFYSTLRAEELHKQGKRVSFLSLILYPKGKFLLNYILRMGFRDGMPGLIVAIIMSFHSFLVRGKLWLLQEKR